MTDEALLSLCFGEPSSFPLLRQINQITTRIYFLNTHRKKEALPPVRDREWETVEFDKTKAGKHGYAYHILIPIEVFERFAPKALKKADIEPFLSWSKENRGRYSWKMSPSADEISVPVDALSSCFRAGDGCIVINRGIPPGWAYGFGYVTDADSENLAFMSDALLKRKRK